MSEKGTPHDDRREPSDWEETVGKDIVTEGDKAQLQEALEAMRRAQQIPKSGPESAREALRRAQENKPQPQSEPDRSKIPELQISEADQARGYKGVQEARDALHNPPPNPSEPPPVEPV